MRDVYSVLGELTEDKAVITEADVWDAISEVYGIDGDISDGDLAEWL